MTFVTVGGRAGVGLAWNYSVRRPHLQNPADMAQLDSPLRFGLSAQEAK